jgi:tetratricopeptide (TPR) repeat protein
MFKDAEFLTIARPNSAAAWNTLGLAQRGLGQLRESVESFTRAIGKAPQYAFTYLNRADSHRALGQYSEALQDCNLAIELDPDFASAYAQRAGVYLALDQAEDAQANCDHALRLQPGNPLAHWYQARLFRRTNANSAALAELDAAVAADPENPNFRFDRAELHRESGSHRLAVVDYTVVLQKHADNVDALFGRARSLARLDEPQAALHDFDRAIELAPKQSGLFHQRARLLRWEGEHAQALADNETAVSLDSGKRQPLVGRALTRWLAGDLGGAVTDFHAALGMPVSGGSNCYPHLWLWQIHMAQGEAEEADAALRGAESSARNPWERDVVALFTNQLTPPELLEKADSVPKKCEALYYIGATALAQGRPAEAAEWFHKTVELNFRDCHEYDLARAFLQSILEPVRPAVDAGS